MTSVSLLEKPEDQSDTDTDTEHKRNVYYEVHEAVLKLSCLLGQINATTLFRKIQTEPPLNQLMFL